MLLGLLLAAHVIGTVTPRLASHHLVRKVSTTLNVIASLRDLSIFRPFLLQLLITYALFYLFFDPGMIRHLCKVFAVR
jgi:hypothetical protein